MILRTETGSARSKQPVVPLEGLMRLAALTTLVLTFSADVAAQTPS